MSTSLFILLTDMKLGFIGAGRATRIIVGGLLRAGFDVHSVVVSDIDNNVLYCTKRIFPNINVASSNLEVAKSEVVFISVPFNSVESVLYEIKNAVNKEKSILVSLAPRISINKMSEILDGFCDIARIVPNAPSIINKGYNPVSFHHGISSEKRGKIIYILNVLGKYIEVEESKLEAYVIASGASPTYFWFQFIKLKEILVELGLSEQEAREAVLNTVLGSVELLFKSDMAEDEIVDLIPLKPLRNHEKYIKDILKEELVKTYKFLKPDA